jgi:hypothetical protein
MPGAEMVGSVKSVPKTQKLRLHPIVDLAVYYTLESHVGHRRLTRPHRAEWWKRYARNRRAFQTTASLICCFGIKQAQAICILEV